MACYDHVRVCASSDTGLLALLDFPSPAFCPTVSSHCPPFLGAGGLKLLISLLLLVMDITDIIKGKAESDEEKQHFIPFHP